MLTDTALADAPYFETWARKRQAIEFAAALALGAICGGLLMWSSAAYLIGALVCFALGLPMGGQHRTLGGAIARAAGAAVVWALGVIALVHAIGGQPATALPHPEPTYLLYAVVPTGVAAAISFAMARRRHS